MLLLETLIAPMVGTMITHDLDLNAILERARKESYQAGYNAALQEVARFINASLGKTLEDIPMPIRPANGRRPRFVEGSLAGLILKKIEAHPDGIYAAEIKDWLRSGSSRYAGHPESGKRVDTALTRLKRHYGLTVKKDDGKWYPVIVDPGSQELAA
jgi:hypothetical protein